MAMPRNSSSGAGCGMLPFVLIGIHQFKEAPANPFHRLSKLLDIDDDVSGCDIASARMISQTPQSHAAQPESFALTQKSPAKIVQNKLAPGAVRDPFEHVSVVHNVKLATTAGKDIFSASRL
jgi:hypothetical protein